MTALAITGCTPESSQTATTPKIEDKSLPHGMSAIRQSGELVVLTVNSPTTYRERSGEPHGYEVELTQALADDLDVRPVYRVFKSYSRLAEAIENGEGHIAAPGLSQRELRMTTDDEVPLFGPAYKTVKTRTVCHRDGARPSSVEDLTELKLGVVNGSGNELTLEEVREDVPDLKWRSLDVSSGMKLADMVHERDLDCAIIDSNVTAIARRKYPDLSIRVDLTNRDSQLAWRIARESSDLIAYLKPWFQKAHQEGLLSELDEQFYGHLEFFDYVEMSTFRDRIESRLPRFEDEFRDAAGSNNLDWTLLASQGYQESHWNPTAKSPTGVRGIMMLTLPTAREVGVENRLDPTESIHGGAAYLNRLYDRLPDSVTGYDRLWIALAAYNVGYGHVLDARRLARQQGLDDSKWRNIRDMLPLLTKPEFYNKVKYGYARGYEPVQYVQRIREYDEALTQNVDRPEQPPFQIVSRTDDEAGEDAGPASGTGAGEP